MGEPVKAVDVLIEAAKSVCISCTAIAIGARRETAEGVRPSGVWESESPTCSVQVDGNRRTIPHQINVAAICKGVERDGGGRGIQRRLVTVTVANGPVNPKGSRR